MIHFIKLLLIRFNSIKCSVLSFQKHLNWLVRYWHEIYWVQKYIIHQAFIDMGHIPNCMLYYTKTTSTTSKLVHFVHSLSVFWVFLCYQVISWSQQFMGLVLAYIRRLFWIITVIINAFDRNVDNEIIFKNSTTDLKLAIFIHIKIHKIKTLLVSVLHFQSSVV